MKNKEDINDVQGDLFISIYSNLWKIFSRGRLFIYLLTDGREHFNVKNKEKNIRNVLDDLFKLVYSNISEECFK